MSKQLQVQLIKRLALNPCWTFAATYRVQWSSTNW